MRGCVRFESGLLCDSLQSDERNAPWGVTAGAQQGMFGMSERGCWPDRLLSRGKVKRRKKVKLSL
jgi:hypothetical protein